MEVRLFYVTCKDKQEAESIAKTLLEEKLVACANIFPEMESFFLVETKKIDKAKETPMILKTKKRTIKRGHRKKLRVCTHMSVLVSLRYLLLEDLKTF